MKFIASLCLLFGFYTGFAQRPAPPAAFEWVVVVESGLPEVLEGFGRAYAVDFAYSPELLAGEKVPPGTFRGRTLEELLAKLLAGTSVRYRVVAPDRVLVRRFATEEEEAPSLLTLTGQITDAADGRPIPYVSICLDTLNLAALTNEDGWFTLRIPPEQRDRRLSVTRLGYRDTIVRTAVFRESAGLAMEIEAVQLAEVMVLDLLPAIGLKTVRSAPGVGTSPATAAFASQPAGNDLFRSLQLLPGVSATNDLSAGLEIRGSNEDETLIVLDGIPIYRADHYYGVFSAVNSAYVEEATLYKNTLPIEYSGRTGGMLLMESAGAIDTFSAGLDVNLLSSALRANLPLSGGWALSLAGRTSYANVASAGFFDWMGNRAQPSGSPDLARRRLIQTVPDFYFNDLNAKLLSDFGEGGRLSVNFFRSRDYFSNTYDNRFRTRDRTVPVANLEDYANEESWGSTGGSLQYDGRLNDRWRFELNTYVSTYRREGRVHSSLTRIRETETRTLGFENEQYNEVRDQGGHLVFSNRDERTEGWRTGLGFSHRDNVFRFRTDEVTLLEGSPESTDAALFAEYRWELLPDWNVTLGGRLHYYDRTGRFYGAPVWQTGYRATPDLSLKGAFSIHYQFVREITHETRLGQLLDFILLSDGGEYPVGKAVNYMVGATFSRGPWEVDAELFHKDLDAVLEHASLFPGFRPGETGPSGRTDYRLFVGDGRITGLDLGLGYDRGVYSGRIAYTLSKLTHRFPEIRNNQPFPAQDDRRHQLKWINSLRLGRFDLSANLIYAGGRPYTDLSRLAQAEDRRDLSPADRISYLPSYQRIDLGLAYRFPVGATRGEAGFSIVNLTNRDNVRYLQYIYSVPANESLFSGNVIGTETNLLDRTLNLFLNWEF